MNHQSLVLKDWSSLNSTAEAHILNPSSNIFHVVKTDECINVLKKAAIKRNDFILVYWNTYYFIELKWWNDFEKAAEQINSLDNYIQTLCTVSYKKQPVISLTPWLWDSLMTATSLCIMDFKNNWWLEPIINNSVAVINI